MRKRITLAMVGLTTLGLAAFVPTGASANSGTTTVTSTVGITGLGVVAIATTPAATLVESGSTLSGSLGLVTVTDTQTGTHAWTVTVKSTDLTLVGATGTVPTIPAGNAQLYMGAPVVAIPGTATVTSFPSSGSKLTLSNTDQNFVQADASNANSVTYTPTMDVSVPAGQAAGVYTGTVTQTVS